ncbi:MAG: nuclear pore complex subunit [Flavobacteriales bacterium CG_4_10_14_0_2_um_filter_32_8]|nr:MAG: nuclear pore complex subunit [Flavobacteriales bacterium CG_4_10_14_0_2_um_filter_32_8]PJB14837.1 MAG: nuclear pore complex subunit [Flavobacteriales bacterium CG_4_9_14_3_um_filter_32_8]
MNTLIIEGKANSPTVNFNYNTGLLKIMGRSIPENPVKFYQPIEDWISDFLKTKPNKVTFYIYLDYLNTHSTECILLLIKKFEGYYKETNAEVKVIWNFDVDDEDMQVLGIDLSSLASVPFEMIEIK